MTPRTADVAGPAEDAVEGGRIHIAIVYSGDDTIRLYRNGLAYGKAYKPEIDLPVGRLQTYLKNDAVIELSSTKELEVLPPSAITEDYFCACVSLPMWFPPVRINNQTYIDAVYMSAVQSLTGSGGWSQIASLAANTTSYSDTAGLSPSTTYFYRVHATNAGGDSANTNTANATIPSALAPPAP